MPYTHLQILLVEDSEDDILLTREALQEVKMLHDLQVVRNGVEALEYLRQQGTYTTAPRPDLILLDLNLPRRNGSEVLVELKGDQDLKKIPVVVLTTSNAPEDIAKSYNLHANSYIVKPVEFENFVTAVRSISEFWFSVVTLPSEG